MLWNATPYTAQAANIIDARGVDCVVVMVKATFVRGRAGLVLADEQVPVRIADVPMDPKAASEGRESSIRYPGEVSGEKPGADVVVVGDAVSAKPVRSVDVGVRAGNKSLSLRVHGERSFYRSAFGLKISPAAAFERAAVTYERAYGGRSMNGEVIDARNPVGRGVYHALQELDGTLAPCIEDPAKPIESAEKHDPVGVGAIASSWAPRRDRLGTADEAWRANRMPLLPLDFDPRFYQVANPSLQLEGPLVEGDLLATTGMSEEHVFDVKVPALRVIAHVKRTDGAKVALPLVIDTALLEPAVCRVELTMRKVVPLGRGKSLLREVRLDVEA